MPITKNKKNDIKAGAAQLAFALTITASKKTIKKIGREKINKSF